jgi:hypothetical protein
MDKAQGKNKKLPGNRVHFLLQKNKGILSVSLDLTGHRSGAFLMPVTSQRMTIQGYHKCKQKG